MEHLTQAKLVRRAENLTLEEYNNGASHEVLVAAYMKKKASKEIPVTGNPLELQIRVDEAKLLEWNTILSKHAARLVLGPEADDVRKHLQHRIMGSRYVITIKQEDDSPPRVKVVSPRSPRSRLERKGQRWRPSKSHLVPSW